MEAFTHPALLLERPGPHGIRLQEVFLTRVVVIPKGLAGGFAGLSVKRVLVEGGAIFFQGFLYITGVTGSWGRSWLLM